MGDFPCGIATFWLEEEKLALHGPRGETEKYWKSLESIIELERLSIRSQIFEII